MGGQPRGGVPLYRLIPINHYGLFYHLENTSTPQTIAFSDRVDQALHDVSLQTVLHRATIRFIGNRSGVIGALQDQNGHIAACRHLLLRKRPVSPRSACLASIPLIRCRGSTNGSYREGCKG